MNVYTLIMSTDENSRLEIFLFDCKTIFEINVQERSVLKMKFLISSVILHTRKYKKN